MISRLMKKSYFSILLCILLLMSIIPLSTISSNAAESEYNTTGATKISFTDSKINVTEGEYDGYKVDGTDLSINEAGTYIISGSCSDGSITVKKGTTGVILVLNNLTLTNSDTAPIACNKSSEVKIVVASGTENSLTDAVKNNDNEYADNENAENAVIKCKDGSQITLCGSGTLNITANGYNGIKSGATTTEEGEAWMIIKDLTLNITANVNDSINAEATLSILSGKLTINAADDGIHSDYNLNIGEKDSEGPTISIEKSNEGIEGATINFYSGDIDINSTDDGINAANSDLTDYSFSINISGGNIYINTPQGDGIDSNGSLSISGGITEVYSASNGDNQPLDSETEMSVTGGTVLAVGSSGMGMKISSDSQPYVIFGNSSGGMGFGGGKDGRGQQKMEPSQEDNGTQPPTKPDSQTQNGQQSGQPIPQEMNNQQNNDNPPELPEGMTNQQGNPPEPPTGVNFSGQKPDNEGQQGNASNLVTAGNTISIKDESGNTIYSAKAVRNASYIFFSSDSVTKDKTYTLLNGSDESATATAGSGSSGSNFGGGNFPSSKNDSNSGSNNTDSDNSGSNASKQKTSEVEKGTFTDVSSKDWYYDAVSFVVNKKLMNGMSSTSFEPNSQTTRGMIVTILYRLSGDTSDDYTCNFKDVSSKAYYYKAVAWASAKGIVTGYDSSTFAPEDNITREQFASILYRYNNLNNTDADSDTESEVSESDSKSNSDYSDSKEISSYAVDAMNWVIKKGIITGTDKGTLEPKSNATRAQAATILMRLCSN